MEINHAETTSTVPAELTRSSDSCALESTSLLQSAINRGAGIEELRLLMDLRDREERWKAEREFDLCFSEMQKKYMPALKKKVVKNISGDRVYNYCPLPEILKIYMPILAQHGFSVRWTEHPIENSERRTTCFLSGHGHTRTAFVDLPVAAQNKMANEIQARGITKEYGRRYSFMDATGCIVADEQDTDGVLPSTSAKDAQKQIALHLPYLPGGMREEYKVKAESENVAELAELVNTIATLRKRCQKILKTAAEKGGDEAKQKVVAGFKLVKEANDLIDWESFVEGYSQETNAPGKAAQ